MKCPNCGNEITGKFCTSCGTPAPVEEPVKEQETQTQPAQSDNFAANNYNSEPAQQNVADNNSQQTASVRIITTLSQTISVRTHIIHLRVLVPTQTMHSLHHSRISIIHLLISQTVCL